MGDAREAHRRDRDKGGAIEQLADHCELSISELVTIAIDYFYGEGRPSP